MTRAIQGVDAGARIEVDAAAREVHVESAEADEVSLLEALARAGYPAERRPDLVG